MTELGPEALEAAEAQFAPRLSDDMKAHLHQAVKHAVVVADLVERKWLNEALSTIDSKVEERDEARQRLEKTTSALDHVLQFARIPRDQRVYFNDILNHNRKLIKESKNETPPSTPRPREQEGISTPTKGA